MSAIQPLLALQEVDARLRDLQQEIGDIPKRKDQEKGRLKSAQEAVTAAKSSLQNIQTGVANLEAEINERRERIKQLRQQQVTLRTNREFAALNQEVASVESQIDGFEMRQIALMDEISPAKAKLDECEEKLKVEQEVVNSYIAELDARLAEAKAELGEAGKERHNRAEEIDTRILLQYMRLLSKRWPPLVPLESGSVCGGCHLTQPPAIRHLLQRNTDLVACQMCGRILYIP